LIVVTTHRRENFGPPLVSICQAVCSLAARPDVDIVWPVHRNPEVRATIRSFFGPDFPILFLEPLGYGEFVELMARSYLIITDSGGVQEEGPSLGKPILVLRDKTERPEAVEAGAVRLVGTDCAAILNAATALLDDPEAYHAMTRIQNPYGDGHASERISRMLASFCDANRVTSTRQP
jgi:UDP-N-acetylglucosamine 2-epimerase (non-hydrolysing)